MYVFFILTLPRILCAGAISRESFFDLFAPIVGAIFNYVITSPAICVKSTVSSGHSLLDSGGFKSQQCQQLMTGPLKILFSGPHEKNKGRKRKKGNEKKYKSRSKGPTVSC